MTTPTQPLPTIGQPNTSEDPKIVAVLTELQAILTAGFDAVNVSATLAGILGLSNGSVISSGASIVATTESRTNVAYGLMTTPDRVQGIVLPTNGLIVVLFQGTWQESVSGAAKAAIFLNSNQLRAVSGATGPAAVSECGLGGTLATDSPLVSFPGGLVSSSATSASSDVTTGQVVFQGTQGGAAYIFAAAGTYDVSVQTKSTSGSVTTKNRRLWVWTRGF